MVAAAWSPGISPRLLGSGALGRDALFQVSQQQHERGRRHAVEPRRLAQACRPVALELLAELGRKPRERGEGEAVGDGDALLLAEGCDVELLPLDVDGIARIDGELLGDLRTELADLGPDRCEPRDIDLGVSQQLESAPLLAVAIDGETMLGG